MADHNLMVLVVDKYTRKVIDCEELNYSWKLDELITRHDLDKVDLIIRERINTKPVAVADASDVNTEVENPPVITEDEDVPF